ncbi:putative protein CHAPERONE-LIKE PROTEIN OF POR1 [Helianthus anomalus]
MTVETTLKLLGVSEGTSFDDILRAKNWVLASCKDDQELIAQMIMVYWCMVYDAAVGCCGLLCTD